MSDEDLTITLTPAQFAALVSNGTLDATPNGWTRLWGGAKALFGGIEAIGAGALLLAPEPGATKVAGVALGAHGIDTIQSGVRQAWTGKETATFTSEGIAALSAALGVDEQTAISIGEDVDLAVPVALTLGIGALRVIAVRSGRIVLAEHEAASIRGIGGHTKRLHIGQTDADLLTRLAKNPKMRYASTFNNLIEAERVVSNVFRVNRSKIIRWAKTAAPNSTERFVGPVEKSVGRILERGSAVPIVPKQAVIVVKKQNFNGKLYYILTAYLEK